MNTQKNIDLISCKDLTRRLSLPISTLYRWMAEGKFPKPVKIGEKRVAWLHSDIEDWLMQRKAQSNQVEEATK